MAVKIAPQAFEGLASDGLRLYFHFEEELGKVELPTNCDGLFASSTSVYGVDFSGADVSQVTSMNGMFAGCSNISELDLRSFNTRNISKENMHGMFQDCSSLKKLDISSFTKEQKDDENLILMFGSDAMNGDQIKKLCEVITDDVDARGGASNLPNSEFVPHSSQQEIIEPAKSEDLGLDDKMKLEKEASSVNRIVTESNDILRKENEQIKANEKQEILSSTRRNEEPIANEVRLNSKVSDTVPQVVTQVKKEKVNTATVELQ